MSDNFFVALNQITNLIASLNKKNYKASVSDINQIIDYYKSDAEHHLFRVLFSTIDFSALNDKSNKDTYKCQLLITEFNMKISKPNFTSLICQAIDNPMQSQKSLKPSTQLIAQIAKILKLSKLQEAVLGLCLTKSSQLEIRNYAILWTKQKLPDLLRSYVDGDSTSKEKGGFQDISMEILHLLLNYLSSDKDNQIIGQDQLNAFLETLRKDFPKESVPVVMSGLLYNESDPSFDKCCKENFTVKLDGNYLANLLEEMGGIVTQNIDDLKNALFDFDSKLICPESVARCICLFSSTENMTTKLQILPINIGNSEHNKLFLDSDKISWNVDNFFTVIFEKNPNINKKQIVEKLDCKYLNIDSKSSLQMLVTCVSKFVTPFPCSQFYGQWQYPEAQFSFLKSCLLYPDVFNLSDFSHKTCNFSTLSTKFEDDNKDITVAYWENIDFVDALLRISEYGLYKEVYDLFDNAMMRIPFILFVCLLQSTFKCYLKTKLLTKIFMRFINNLNLSPSYFVTTIINYDYAIYILLNSIFETYKEADSAKNLTCAKRLVDIISYLNYREIIIPNGGTNFNLFKANYRYCRYEVMYFALDAFIIISKKECIKNWILEVLTKDINKVQYYKAIVKYLSLRYPKLLQDHQETKYILPPELILDSHYLADIISILDKIGRYYINDPYLSQEIKCVDVMINRLMPQITNTQRVIHSIGSNQLRPSSGSLPMSKLSKNKLDPTKSAFVPGSKLQKSDMSNPYEIYSQVPPHESLMSKQIKYTEAQNDLDKPEFISIDQELDRNLSKMFAGDISIDKLCDTYCTPSNGTRDHFHSMIKILIEELSYIDSYPEKQAKIFADLLVKMLSLEKTFIIKEDIIKLQEKIQQICNEGKCGKYREYVRGVSAISQNVLRRLENENAVTNQNFAALTTVTPPNVQSTVEAPPDAITEKVFFIINNVSKMNVQEKSARLAEVVTQDYMGWFAQYIVMKRVTTESNFHDLFIQLIDNMAETLPGLKEKVLSETYRNIKILLMNMKYDFSDFNDRQILKNLGKFLGLITLAKNKPILHDDMNLKDLLYEAFSKGALELHYVVPFVTKTLETATNSIVFKPPCPWTMAILKVLKELHEMESVKLNLKFEVEILCKNLKLDVMQLTPVHFLRDRNIRIENALCRVTNVPVSPTRNEIVSNENDTQNTLTLANRVRAPLNEHIPRTAPINTQKPQGFEVMDGNKSSNFRSNISYQQAISTVPQNIPRSNNFQNLGIRTVQNIPQFYTSINMPQNVGQHVHSTASGLTPTEHGHPLRSMNSVISYEDLNIQNILPYFNVEDIPSHMLSQISDLKNHLILQMEKVITDLVPPLFDRCAKITLSTVEQLVMKDFGTECDINIIKQNAFAMCRYLTAGLCLVTAREVIGVHLNTAVKQTILREYRHANSQDKDQVENFANRIVHNNNDICVALLQKIIAEKAIVDLEKKLSAFDTNEGNLGTSFTTQELQVYENFSRTIPGFQSVQQTIPAMNYTANYANVIMSKNQVTCDTIDRIFSDIERHMQQIDIICHNDGLNRQLRNLIDSATLAFKTNEASLMHKLARDVITSLMNLYHTQNLIELGQPHCVEIIERVKEAHMHLVRNLQPYDESNGFVSMCKLVTSIWLSMEEPKQPCNTGPGKYNAEAFSELLKNHIISLVPVDLFLSKKISENNTMALLFTLDLLKYFITGEKREYTVLNEFDLSSCIDAMNKLVTNNSQKLQTNISKSLTYHLKRVNQFLELGCLDRGPACNYLYNGISLSREFDDPPGITEKTEIMIRMWIEHYNSNQQRNTSSIMNIINNMASNQIIHNEEYFFRFLRLATVYVVERAYNNLKTDVKYNSNKNLTYNEIDAYSMLVSCLINRSQLNKNEVSSKIQLLSKSIGIIAGTLLQEHEVRRDFFHPMPFQRIFIMLFNELQLAIEEDHQQHILTAYVHAYHVIRPKCAPAFVFSWLELISHRNFVSKILRSNATEYTHSLYVQLLCDLFSFLYPYLENLHLPRPIQLIYKGTVNIICLLMHDFPEILINYHSMLCSCLPITCIQLRNIILCTTTKEMSPLPDVLSINCLDQISQIKEDPKGYCMSAGDRIMPKTLRMELDSYLVSRAPVKFLSELVNRLKKENELPISNLTILTPKEIVSDTKIPEEYVTRNCYMFKSNGIIHYDVELMNNVILYLCITAIKVLREKNIPLNINTIAHTAQMDIIQSLVLNLDNEGRFLLLNCMVNQLRYPNCHTFYFINTILYLFAEQPQESVKEQITRVILERIIINRPHPWGLLMVMNELFKNPMYKFWEHKFLTCSEEIENILESVGQGFGSSVPHQNDDIRNPASIVAES